MKTKRLFIISLVIFLAIIALPLQASDDKNNPDISDHEGAEVELAVCDIYSGIVYYGLEIYPVLFASENLISTHCATSDSVLLPHFHWLEPADAEFWATVDMFWDYRFLDGVKTIRIENASFDHQTCTEYALNVSPAEGLYNFELHPVGLFTELINDDLETVDPGEVENGDILFYSLGYYKGHFTSVANTSGGHPSTTKWCWQQSGVYWMQGEMVGVDPYDTPMCAGEPVHMEYIGNQPWTWDPDYCTDPTIYSEKE